MNCNWKTSSSFKSWASRNVSSQRMVRICRGVLHRQGARRRQAMCRRNASSGVQCRQGRCVMRRQNGLQGAYRQGVVRQCVVTVRRQGSHGVQRCQEAMCRQTVVVRQCVVTMCRQGDGVIANLSLQRVVSNSAKGHTQAASALYSSVSNSYVHI